MSEYEPHEDMSDFRRLLHELRLVEKAIQFTESEVELRKSALTAEKAGKSQEAQRYVQGADQAATLSQATYPRVSLDTNGK